MLDIWYIPFIADKLESSSCLSAIEKKKADSFVKKVDKQRYIQAHLFLRQVLSHYYPSVKEEAWSFKVNEYGKPYLSPFHQKPLYFNLSHSQNHIYIIISKTHECGIDVEEIKDLDYSSELINLVFSDNEKQAFKKTQDKDKFFFKYWTLKEAYIKALGKGVSHPLTNIEFESIDLESKFFCLNGVSYGSFFLEDSYCLSVALLNTNKQIQTNFYTKEDL